MPTFLCKIGTSDGRVIEKEFDAANRDLLRESLEEQGFFVFQIKKRPFQFLRIQPKMGGRLSGARFLSFNQELLVLVRSGLPILQVLDTLVERMEAGGMRAVLQEVRDEVKGGSALSEAMEKFPDHFPHLYVASVKAGERTGDLPVTLERYLQYQKRVEAIKAKVKSASFYPIILVSFTLIVLAFLLVYVVPRFTQIYADADAQLPLITRIIIGISGGLVELAPLLLVLVVAAVVAGRTFLRTERGALLFDRLRLSVPYLRSLLIDYAISGFCRTLGTILASGVPLVQALRMSRGTLNNRVLENRMIGAIRTVEEGGGFSGALEETGFFPLIALRMIGVGETTGALTQMLGDVADYYEGEVEKRLERVTHLIEPLLMLTMGLLIGGVVVAMYLPIFQLAGAVG